MLRVPDTAATIASGVLVGLYVSVTDLGAPVQRAAFACVVYMLARLLYRERNPLDALGVVALAALVMDPKALFDAGFQMTLLAVFTIAGIVVPIMDRTTAVYQKALQHIDSMSYDLHLLPKQAHLRVGLRMILTRLELLLPRWMSRFIAIGGLKLAERTADLILISALMQAALALPMAVYFHRATTLALPANLAVVPIMSFMLPVAIATTLLSYAGAWLVFIPRCATRAFAAFDQCQSCYICALSRCGYARSRSRNVDCHALFNGHCCLFLHRETEIPVSGKLSFIVGNR